MEKMSLEQLAKEGRNQYCREWRSKNKDKLKDINRRYWSKYAEKKRQEKLEGQV